MVYVYGIGKYSSIKQSRKYGHENMIFRFEENSLFAGEHLKRASVYSAELLLTSKPSLIRVTKLNLH